MPLTPKPPSVNTVVTTRSHRGGEEIATAVVTVATEVRHTRVRIKCARAREKGIQRIEEATSRDSESGIPCKRKVDQLVKKREFKTPSHFIRSAAKISS